MATTFTPADIGALNALDDDNKTLIRGLLTSRRQRRDLSAGTREVIGLTDADDFGAQVDALLATPETDDAERAEAQRLAGTMFDTGTELTMTDENGSEYGALPRESARRAAEAWGKQAA